MSSDGAALAVRGADGRLMIHRNGRDAFTAKEWLAADGDARLPNDKSLGGRVPLRCPGLRGRPAGRQAGVSGDPARRLRRRLHPGGGCRHQPRDAGRLPALAIDRKLSRGGGAIALRRSGEGFAIERARPAGQDRPWARGSAVEETGRSRRHGRSRATPRRRRRIWKRGIETACPGRDAARSAALQTRDRSQSGKRNGPGSAAHHQAVLRCARDKPDQYRRNSPTILPWMRTRVGGRMRTS